MVFREYWVAFMMSSKAEEEKDAALTEYSR